MLFTLVAFLSLSIPHLCQAQAMNGVANVTRAFSKAKIVPKVIKSFTPIETLSLNFTDSATAENVAAVTGSLLTIEQTANEPHFALGRGNRLSFAHDPLIGINNSYVIVMFDPDAPTPQMPNVSQALHFIGGNFTIDSSGTLLNSSAALVEYLSPAPPEGSDPHRYIALVYNQPHDFDTIGPSFANSSTSRFNFSVSDFARSTKLRSPISGNFFLVARSSSSDSSNVPASCAAVNGTASANATATAPGATSAAVPDMTSGVASLTPTSPAVTPSASAPVSTSSSTAVSWKVNVPIPALISAASAVILIITRLV
ncbi:hypothetical protein D9619_010797 [Psilocybe cf. subviscida]|uniref:PEBP-like protein n=1 Tax=Psilocybe cf. subviscida TaxID=2480587 RepID=A0A8H5BA51_9AGAR|nr:hypothetical protein D9619_010797 [Psilocybe cf. subviscida]